MEWKGQGKETGLEKNIFTEDRVLFASGLRWVASNFVPGGENQVINYSHTLEMGCL